MQGGGFLIFLVAMFAIMYFLLIRPQRAKQRAAQDLLSQLAPGDEIVTVGGIYGDVVLEIAEDVDVEVARKAVAQIVHDTEPAEPDEDDAAGPDDGALPAEPQDGAEAAEPEPVREEKRWGGVFGRRE